MHNSQTAYGDADAVPDTPDVIGRNHRDNPTSATDQGSMRARGGGAPVMTIVWAVLALVIVLMALYGAGILGH